MRIKIDEENCTGCELCVDTCPELFEMNEDGTAMVLVDEVPEDQEDCAREAAENCAVEAITLIE